MIKFTICIEEKDDGGVTVKLETDGFQKQTAKEAKMFDLVQTGLHFVLGEAKSMREIIKDLPDKEEE